MSRDPQCGKKLSSKDIHNITETMSNALDTYKTYRDNQTTNDNAGPVIGMSRVSMYVHVWSPTNQCNLKDDLFKAKLRIYQYIENERHSVLTNVDAFNNSSLQVLSCVIMNTYGIVCCVFHCILYNVLFVWADIIYISSLTDVHVLYYNLDNLAFIHIYRHDVTNTGHVATGDVRTD